MAENKYETLLGDGPPPVVTPAPNAQTRLQAAGDTPPQSGADAYKYGPQLGLNPDVALPAAGQVKAQAEANKYDSILDQNPTLNGFVSQSQAKATVSKDDIFNLDNLSKVIGQAFLGVGSAVVSAIGSQGGESSLGSLISDKLAGQHVGTLNEDLGEIAPPTTKAEAVSRKYSPFLLGGLFGPEAGAGVAAQIGTRALNIAAPLGGYVGGKQGVKALGGTPEEQEAGGLVGSLIAGFVPHVALNTRLFGPVEGRGTPTVDEYGNHPTNDLGEVVDREGTPYSFNSKFEAGLWAKKYLAETGQDFGLLENNDTGTVSIVDRGAGPEAQSPLAGLVEGPKEEPEAAPEPEAPAQEITPVDEPVEEAGKESLNSLVEAVKATKLQGRSPELMEDFLEQHGLGEASVYVPLDTINEVFNSVKDPEAQTELAEFLLKHVPETHIPSAPVEFPLSAFLAGVAGKPWEQGLVQAASFEPQGGKEEPKKAEYIPEDIDAGGTWINGKGYAIEIKASPPQNPHTSFTYKAPYVSPFTESAEKNYLAQVLTAEGWTKTSLPNQDALQGATPQEAQKVQTLSTKVARAVKQVAQERGLDKLFQNNKAIGLTKQKYNYYADKTQAALDDLNKRTFEKLVKYFGKEAKQRFNEVYNHYLDHFTADSLEQPVVKAAYALRYGEDQERKELTQGNAFVEPDGKPMTFAHFSENPYIGTTPKEQELLGQHTDYGWFKPVGYKVISFKYVPPGKETVLGGYAADRKFAYVVHLRAKAVGDFRKPDDVQAAANWFGTKNGEPPEAFSGDLRRGSYSLWENVQMQKALGWEGSYMLEQQGQITDDNPLHANVQDGSQVYFKYVKASDNIKIKIDPAEKALYPDLAKLPNVYFGKDGWTMDQIASHVGAGSGEELAKQLAEMEQTKGVKKDFRKWHVQQIKDAAKAAALDTVGDITHPDAIMAAAREAFQEAPVESLLTDQLQQLKNQLEPGQKINKEDIQGQALENFYAKPVNQAINIKALEAGMKNAADAVETAMQKGKTIEAFKAKQDQLELFYQLREAHAFRQEFLKGVRKFSQLGKKAAFGNLDPEVTNLIQARLSALGFRISLDQNSLARNLAVSKYPDIKTFVQEMAEAGVPLFDPQIPAGLASRNKPVISLSQFARSLSAEDFLDQLNLIKAMEQLGRDLSKVKALGQEAEINELAEQVLVTTNGIGGGKTPQEIQTSRRNFWSKASSYTQSVLAANLRPETFLHWMDGETQGPLSRYVVANLMEGKHKEIDLEREWHDAMTGFEGAKLVHNSMHRDLSMPDWMVWQSADGPVRWIDNRGSNIMAVLNLGTAARRAKLFRGFELPEERWDEAEAWMLSKLTPEEKTFVQTVWDQFEKLAPMADQVARNIRGYGIKLDPGRAVGDMRGGYFPLKYDQRFEDLAQLSNPSASKEGASIDSRKPMTQMPSNGYTKELTGFNAPMDLNYMHLPNVAAEMIHDIAFREPLLNAQKLLLDPRVLYATQKLLGPEYKNQLLPWLNYIASERVYYDPATAEAGSLIQKVAGNIAYAHIAWEAFSAIKHMMIASAHLSTAMDLRLDLMSGAFNDLVGGGPRQQAWRQWVHDNLGEVRAVKTTWDASLHDVLGKNPYGLNRVSNLKEWGLHLFTYQKILEAYLLGLAKYRHEMEIHGDHELAILNTNKAIRDTLGAGHTVDVPALFRGTSDSFGGAFSATFTRFMGFENTGYNRAWTATQQLRLASRRIGEGDAEGAANAAGGASKNILGYVIAGAFAVALFETYVQGHTDPKHPKDSLAENLNWSLGQNTIGSIPGMNEIFAGLRGFGEGGMLGSYAEQAAKTVTHAKQKDELAKVINTLGAPIGIPDSVGWEVQNFYDMMNPQRLKPESKTPYAWTTKVLAGRRTVYNPTTTRSRGGGR